MNAEFSFFGVKRSFLKKVQFNAFFETIIWRGINKFAKIKSWVHVNRETFNKKIL